MEIDPPEDYDLSVGRQLSESSDDPGGVLDDTADLALNVDCEFAGVVDVED